MKTSFKRLLPLLLLSLPAVVQAQFTFTTNNGAITITGYTGSGGAVTIPSSTNGYPVTSIGFAAFSDCWSLTSVTIPSSVTNIGYYAFETCGELTSVTIPNSVISIGDYAFEGCYSLSSITVPSSVNSIGIGAFGTCTSLTTITVDASNPLYSSVDGVLFNKSRTTLIQYPAGKAGGYMIPSSVTSIGSEAFYNCTRLTDITFANSVTSIGNEAFYNCSSLYSVSIPSGVTSIGDKTFLSCGNLTSVTIPSSVTTIGNYAFGGCGRLYGVYFQGNAPSLGADVFSFHDDYVTVYYLPETTGWASTFGGRPAVPVSGPLAPIVQSLAAGLVTASAATLNSYVNANGLSTTIYFQYGLTSGYGSTTLSGNIGTAVGYFATPASGLTANTPYHFRIVASNSSGTSCGNDMTFTTGQSTAQVSAALSTLAVSPSSALADGQGTITATVTLRNGSSNPVAGKTVRLQSVAGVTICQPANPTDGSGRATATITATAPITASLCAIDTTDSVIVMQQPTVQFTTSFAPPSAVLGDAIVQLCNSSSNLLTHSIAGIAVDEGGYGDYFQTQIASDKRAQGVTALSVGIDSIITLLAPESKSVVLEVAKAIGPDLGLTGLSSGLDKIIGSSSGLAQFGQTVVGNNASWRQSEFNAKQQLMSGVLPVTANHATAYANDIGLRIQANTALKEIVLSQHNLLLDLQQNAEVAHVDLLTWLFADLNVVPTVAGTIVGTPSGGKAASTLLGLAESLDTYAVNQRNLNSDQQAYNTAVVSLIDCDHVSRLIDANTESAFNAILQGQPPSPVTGTIVNVDSEKTYVPLSGITGDLVTWGGLLFANTKYVKVTGAYSIVTVQNTSQRAAAFSVHASYWHTVTIRDMLGNDNGWMATPMVMSAVANIGKGETAQIRLDYFDGAMGGVPDDGTPISLSVLGYDSNNGIFAVGFANSTMQWSSVSGVASDGSRTPKGPHPLDTTNLFALVNPIKSVVSQNPTNQTYQAQIWVVNPFAIPLQTTVTQSLPPGVTVLSTDGVLGSTSIVWTRTIPTNGLAGETFTFTLPTMPGAETNLPAPTLVFRDAIPTNSLALDSLAADFSGLFPALVEGSVPTGTWGANAPMDLTVTNLTSTGQVGSLTISVIDGTGTVVANFSQSFSVGGLGSTNLHFSLPGALPTGSYSVTGSLSMNRGSGQVLAGTYVMPSAPIVLVPAPRPALTDNGFSMALQGPAGSYLIEASADVSNPANWQPLLYYFSTNSSFSFYFSDSSATNADRRFYRVSLLSGASVAPPIPIVLGFGPRPLAANGVNLMLQGPIGANYVIQSSTNLVNWVPFTNFVSPSSPCVFRDTGATNFSRRFYRAVMQ